MVWTIQSDKKYEKSRDKAGLMISEERKLDAWLADVPMKGPYEAAKEQHIECTKLKGYDEWHLYLGSYQRLFFSVDDFHTVKLIGIGHT